MEDFLSTKAINRPSVVIGAGTMGARIALMLATRGGHVRIFNRREETALKARAYVEETLPSVVASIEHGQAGTIETFTDLE